MVYKSVLGALLLIALVACEADRGSLGEGGSDASESDARTDGGSGDTGGTRTCEDIRADYESRVSGVDKVSCTTSADCHLVFGHCAVSLGGCYYVVNTTVTQAELETLKNEFVSSGCTGPVCSCAAPPQSVQCNASLQCEFGP